MGATARLAIRSAFVASMLAASGWPATVAAAEDDEVVTLGGFTASVGVIDLDGDGVRDLVRLVGESERGPLEVEAWIWDGDQWTLVGGLTLDLPQTGSRPFVGGTESPVTPIVWNDGRQDRLLLATGEPQLDTGGVTSLRLHVLELSASGLDLTSVLADGGPAERVEAADLDADGVEEIIVTEPGGHLGRDRAVSLLRWTGEGFAADRVVIGDGSALSEPILGETDGHPGVDLLFTGDGELYRLAPAISRRVEVGQLPSMDAGQRAWPVAVAGNALLMYADGLAAAEVLRVQWPAGGDPAVEIVASDDPGTWNLWPIDTDDGDLYLVDYATRSDGRLLGAVIRDDEMRPLARVAPAPAVELTTDWVEHIITGGPYGMPAFAYTGLVPGGVDGETAMVLAGNLITFGEDGVEVRPAGSLAGVSPLGLLGPADAWVAVAPPWYSPWSIGYLYAQPRIEESVRIAPVEAVLAEERNGGALDVELRGATRVTEPDGTWVASPNGGFDIVLRGMPGSAVTALVDKRPEASGVIGPDGTLVLRLDPGREREGTVDYAAAVAMATPTGHLYGTEWPGRVLRDPPGLEAEAVTATGSFSAIVSGTIDGTATVTVDGQPVSLADGAFEMTVDAGLLPRDVTVVATDPLGIETARRVQVVGFVDHRGWPWPVFVGVLIAAAGAVMFVRVPRGRPPEVAIETDATIEEIEVP